jgi:hypothetical protein
MTLLRDSETALDDGECGQILMGGILQERTDG